MKQSKRLKNNKAKEIECESAIFAVSFQRNKIETVTDMFSDMINRWVSMR